jgi:hypothetical protein
MYVVKQTLEGLDRGCIVRDEKGDVSVSVSPAPAEGSEETSWGRFEMGSLYIGVYEGN